MSSRTVGAPRTLRPRHRPLERAGLVVALALGLHGSLAGQAPTQILGVITGTPTGNPIEGATVIVVGTQIAGMTDPDGRYELSLPPQSTEVTLRAFAVGFAVDERFANVSPGTGVVIDFELVGLAPSGGPPLIGPVSPEDSLPTEVLQLLFSDERRLGHEQIYFHLFDPRTPALELFLADTLTVRLRPERIDQVSSRHFRWIARVEDPPRHREERAHLVVRDGVLTGNVRLDDRLFHIRPQATGVHAVIEVDRSPDPDEEPPQPSGIEPADLPTDPAAPSPRPFFPVPAWAVPNLIEYVLASSAPDACTDFENLKSGPFPEVRLLVLYTTEVETVGGIEDDVDLWILEGNDALEESGIRQRLALSRLEHLETTETVGIIEMAKRLQDPEDGTWDEVHDLRDEYFADVVMLITENTCCGKTFSLKNVTMQHGDSAFAVVRRESAHEQLTFIHELGHVMGAQHERPSPYTMQPYGYNHGFEFGIDGKGTLMATGVERVLRFSNPSRTYDGYATGIPSGQPLAADNARAIQNVGAVVSAFRLSPVWFVSAGASAPWLEKRVATEAGREIRFGDFDGDGETDAFKADEATGTWWWSRSAAGPWAVLAPADPSRQLPITQLAFGDFDGNDTTDVFHPTEVVTGETSEGVWLWSRNGTDDWQTLNGPPHGDLHYGVWDLAFGDFDGNGTTDVFRSDKGAGEWFWSKDGTEAWDTLNGADPTLAFDVSELGFADFDGDGEMDVFASAGGVWRWSKSGTAPWDELGSRPETRSSLAFGDFDGDGKDDAFKADGESWWISRGGTEPWEGLLNSCYGLQHLSFGDFDGDGTTDVFRNGRRP